MSLVAGAGEEDNSDDELLGQQSNNLGFTPTRTASEPVGYALRARSSSFAQKPKPDVQNALLRGAFRNFRFVGFVYTFIFVFIYCYLIILSSSLYVYVHIMFMSYLLVS